MQSAEISMQPAPLVKHPGTNAWQSASFVSVFVVGQVISVQAEPLQVHALS